MSEQPREGMPSIADAVPNYVPPTPEHIVQRQAAIAEQVRVSIGRLARTAHTLALLGGTLKETALDARYDVSYDVDVDEVAVSIAGETNPVDMEDQVRLSLQAALRLHEWLSQEKPILERLAKEQEK